MSIGEKLLLRTIVNILDDDEGISEKGYNCLIEILDVEFPAGYPNSIQEALSKVRATNGRFYILKWKDFGATDVL